MRFTCRWSISTLSLVASLTPVARPALADVRAPSAQALPRGIHVARDGRFHEDVCDLSAGRYCCAERLLLGGFRPQDYRARVYRSYALAPAFGGQLCEG